MPGLSITLQDVTKSFGSEAVLKDINLSIKEGELVSLLGPSGCGKSTLLRIIAGLERAEAGSIRLGEQVVDALPAGARDLAMVFQSYALYPHMCVADNIALSLEMTELSALQRLPLLGRVLPGSRAIRQAISNRVRQAADLTEIAHLLRRRPAHLSGGQRQRVALARAMAREPGIFLMDEPLSNLDAKLRISMRSEIVDLNKRIGATFLFVTHDQSDALAMSDRIALMMGGRIRQIGTPQEIYDSPSHLDVASFIGQPVINLFPVNVDSAGRVRLVNGTQPFGGCSLPNGSAKVGVRPEAFDIVASEPLGTRFALTARLDRVERMGAEVLIRCRTMALGASATCRLSVDQFDEVSATGILSGAFHLVAQKRGVHLFDEEGNAAAFHPLLRTEMEVAK
ncbi:ABC transporter ATP-binding protein [Phyllobacterium zundukense]|uniref:ABC transporter ATP-binding protein n=1 Tax=Phyllobacterium zundukense TaxID=1867719 RepID=A0ACD4CVG0_9HYPH|nr:ABC transporter ATP-binding protein [Phyllobacterium zundukense]UXN57541.1 ABC transporter ATP-binding protein [Phyllobacterium zundukense]